ncbi:MAG: galactose oxidase early set domain-containing protein [Planctomycetota bacterium]
MRRLAPPLVSLLASIALPAQGSIVSTFNHTNDGFFQLSASSWQELEIVLPPPTGLIDPHFNALHIALIPTRVPFTSATGAEDLQGRVVVWTYGRPPTLEPCYADNETFWSIVDPEPEVGADPQYRFMNFRLDHSQASAAGSLACAGHTWLEDGRLFVAGGVKKWPCGSLGEIIGTQLTYIFDPAGFDAMTGGTMWKEQDALYAYRYYPSCTLLGNGDVLVTGGHTKPDPGYPATGTVQVLDDYEVFDVSAGAYEPPVYDGPTQVMPMATSDWLWVYPRAHLLSNGRVFISGMYDESVALWHEGPTPVWGPEQWKARGVSGEVERQYGTSVLLPNVAGIYKDSVMIIGGGYTPVDQPASTITLGGPRLDHPSLVGCSGPYDNYHDTAEFCKANRPNSGCHPGGNTWTGQGSCPGVPSMTYERAYPNSVLLPDGSVLVVGGKNSDPIPWPAPMERYYPTDTGWQVETLAPLHSVREYHSTAILLPSGNVLIAGGECRWGQLTPPSGTGGTDYEIYAPPYFDGAPARPQWTLEPEGLVFYNSQMTLSYSGPAVDHVVLMRPASLTHHSCSDQRYLELETVSATHMPIEGLDVGGTIRVKLPPGRPGQVEGCGAPAGYYMMFMVTASGVPSEARFVRLL